MLAAALAVCVLGVVEAPPFRLYAVVRVRDGKAWDANGKPMQFRLPSYATSRSNKKPDLVLCVRFNRGVTNPSIHPSVMLTGTQVHEPFRGQLTAVFYCGITRPYDAIFSMDLRVSAGPWKTVQHILVAEDMVSPAGKFGKDSNGWFRLTVPRTLDKASDERMVALDGKGRITRPSTEEGGLADYSAAWAPRYLRSRTFEFQTRPSFLYTLKVPTQPHP